MPRLNSIHPSAVLAFALAITASTPPARANVPPSQPAAPTPVMPGGWSELRPDHAELVAAARYVVPRLGRHHARLRRIEGGERQVVAGMNYRVVLQLSDRSRWRAQVWRKLDGSYALTRSERIR